MRVGTFVGCVALAMVAGGTHAHAEKPVIRAFESKMIRPVPGYTAACKNRWNVADRLSGTDVEVVAVAADGSGSRVRQLSKADNGLAIEFNTRFAANGAVRGLPEFAINGKLQEDSEARHISRAWKKYLAGTFYSGRPVSSGDELSSQMTRDEFQSMIDRFWQRPAQALSWSDVGRIVGALDHATFGEVVVVEWAAESVLKAFGERLNLSFRVIEYYDTASGILVAYHSASTFSGRHGDVAARENYLCEFVERPGRS
jgi:hypothetical protein